MSVGPDDAPTDSMPNGSQTELKTCKQRKLEEKERKRRERLEVAETKRIAKELMILQKKNQKEIANIIKEDAKQRKLVEKLLRRYFLGTQKTKDKKQQKATLTDSGNSETVNTTTPKEIISFTQYFETLKFEQFDLKSLHTQITHICPPSFQSSTFSIISSMFLYKIIHIETLRLPHHLLIISPFYKQHYSTHQFGLFTKYSALEDELLFLPNDDNNDNSIQNSELLSRPNVSSCDEGKSNSQLENNDNSNDSNNNTNNDNEEDRKRRLNEMIMRSKEIRKQNNSRIKQFQTFKNTLIMSSRKSSLSPLSDRTIITSSADVDINLHEENNSLNHHDEHDDLTNETVDLNNNDNNVVTESNTHENIQHEQNDSLSLPPSPPSLSSLPVVVKLSFKIISHCEEPYTRLYSRSDRRVSGIISGRNPFAKDTTLLSYDEDDEIWEDIENESDNSEEDESEEEDDDGFIVPDGYLSEDEKSQLEFEDNVVTTTTLIVPSSSVIEEIPIFYFGISYNLSTDVDMTCLEEYPVIQFHSLSLGSGNGNNSGSSGTTVKNKRTKNSFTDDVLFEFAKTIHGNSLAFETIISQFHEIHPSISKYQLRAKMKELGAKKVKGIWTLPIDSPYVTQNNSNTTDVHHNLSTTDELI